MTRRQRRPPFILILVAVLFVLLPLLAVFQYQWLGEVSEGERQELQQSLQRTADEFRSDFDREIASIYRAFDARAQPQTTADASNESLRRSFAAVYKNWAASSLHPELVAHLFLILPGDGGKPEPEQWNPASNRFEAIGWPEELVRFRDAPETSTIRMLTEGVSLPHPMALSRNPVDPRMPALVIALLDMSGSIPGGMVIGKEFGQAVIQLNLEYLQKEFIGSLIRAHFPAGKPDFNLAVIDTSTPARVIYSDTGSADPTIKGDVRENLFSAAAFEIPDVMQERATANEGAHTEPVNKTFAVRVMRSGSAQRATAALFGAGAPGWQLVITHRAGSLDAAVSQLRHRNLAISFSILLLLGLSIGTLLVSVQRERRLAQQQMEFVSTVSHELKTPLAVICSAGENLADGVVEDLERTRKYGALVRNEGRRLSEMVEQILDFAGIESGQRVYVLKPVSPAEVVERALASFDLQLHERGAIIEKALGEASMVQGDRDVLVRAVQNLIANSLKYSADPCWLSVRTETKPDAVEFIVEDRGSGIPASELPHIFEPFYRGHSVVEAQIKGSGLGLALVRQITEAHHGRVTVDSAVGKGSRFAIILPRAGATS